jgi:beta-phosphoglucomutase
MNMKLKGAIFDMDGVIVNTVPLHFKAWKRMFKEYGHEFDMHDYNEKVDGIPRADGARAILAGLSEEELHEATEKKQAYFLEYLNKEEIPVFKSTIAFIKELKKRGVKIAVISSSRNAQHILEKTGVMELLDINICCKDVPRGKPAPDIHLTAAKKIGEAPETCIAFESALLGVEAAKRANMVCVGIDRNHDPERLQYADLIISDLSELNFEKMEAIFRR